MQDADDNDDNSTVYKFPPKDKLLASISLAAEYDFINRFPIHVGSKFNGIGNYNNIVNDGRKINGALVPGGMIVVVEGLPGFSSSFPNGQMTLPPAITSVFVPILRVNEDLFIFAAQVFIGQIAHIFDYSLDGGTLDSLRNHILKIHNSQLSFQKQNEKQNKTRDAMLLTAIRLSEYSRDYTILQTYMEQNKVGIFEAIEKIGKNWDIAPNSYHYFIQDVLHTLEIKIIELQPKADNYEIISQKVSTILKKSHDLAVTLNGIESIGSNMLESLPTLLNCLASILKFRDEIFKLVDDSDIDKFAYRLPGEETTTYQDRKFVKKELFVTTHLLETEKLKNTQLLQEIKNRNDVLRTILHIIDSEETLINFSENEQISFEMKEKIKILLKPVVEISED